jgi:CRISPR/Cas system Type II protein with McrA/HNH and RuvC-like nuclease domain
MAENHDSALNVLAGLQNALGRECPDCGEINAGDAEDCEFCGYKLPKEEAEEAAFTFVHSEGMTEEEAAVAGKINKELVAIPLEKAKNLQILRDMADGIMNGEISKQDYDVNVSRVLNIAKAGAELFSIPIFKDKILSLPEEQKNIALTVGKGFEKYYLGCRKMMEPHAPGQFDGVAEGLRIVEEALAEMGSVQNRAIEIAKEEREKEEEEKSAN